MEQDFSLSPSEAYSRIKELTKKSDYEILNDDEMQELKSLKEMYHESLSDYGEYFY